VVAATVILFLLVIGGGGGGGRSGRVSSDVNADVTTFDGRQLRLPPKRSNGEGGRDKEGREREREGWEFLIYISKLTF